MKVSNNGKTVKLFYVLALGMILAGVFVIAGCDNPFTKELIKAKEETAGTGNETVAVTGVSLNKKSTIMAVGSTQKLIPTVEPANAANKAVNWSSNNETVAEVTSSGTVLAKALGNVTITVTTVDGGKTDTCDITVSAAATAVTGVTLNKTAAALSVGGWETLTATVAPANADNKNITWSSNNESAAEVTNGGTVIAIAPGTATITAATEDGGNTATCAVTVSLVAVTGVTMNKSATSINIGFMEQLVATVEPGNADNKNIIWSSSSDSVAAVSSSGLVTAYSPGTATITAESAADSTKTADCTVTVATVTIPVTGVSLTPTASIVIAMSTT